MIEVFIVFAGVLFIGKVWEKIRPMLEIKKGEIIYHAGISHSFKKGMVPLSKDDLIDSKLDIEEGSYCGLSNKSQVQLKYGEIGQNKEEYDQKVLDANKKLESKINKRNL